VSGGDEASGLRPAPAVELAHMVRSKEVSAAEVTAHYLGAIEACDGELHAFVTVMADAARAQAAEVDRKIAAGEDPGALAVPAGGPDPDAADRRDHQAAQP